MTVSRKNGAASIEDLLNAGLQHYQAGRLAEADALYRQALTVDPRHTDALHLMGVLAHDVGRHDVAAELIRKAIAQRSDIPFFYNNLGNALLGMGRPDEAVTNYRHALALKPDYGEAFNNLGTALKEQRHFDEALTAIGRALELMPGQAEPYNSKGSVFRAQGRDDEALACFRQALALNAHYAEAYFNIGSLLRDQGDVPEAIKYLRQAIALKPGFADAHMNLGQCLQQTSFDDAIASFERALALKPDSTQTLNNLGVVFQAQGKLREAIAYYKRALALKPELTHIHSNLLMAMVYTDSVPPQELADTAKAFGEKMKPLRRDRPLLRDRDPARKLRIGYVSPDFRLHAVNYFFEPLLKLHDRARFEIFAYSNTLKPDSVTARLREEFDHWRDILRLSDDEAADLIEADEIDILVDLAGHTANNRLPVFARKPAPLQVTWLGYPATTGMEAMDYRITDAYAEPPGMTEHLNAETLWRLPEIFCCYQPREKSPAAIDHAPFEDNGYITFGCFNNFSKVTDPALAAWAKIMEQVPDSRLLLEIGGLDSPLFRATVEDRMRRVGLPLERVMREPFRSVNQYVFYNRIDIALDPFPCVGGTTSFDTMWMGVPLVTLAGRHFTSRMGVSILTNAGMPELVSHNADEYVRLAAALAMDKDRLRALRYKLRTRVVASPLMNQENFARNIETAYREMWQNFCRSQ